MGSQAQKHCQLRRTARLRGASRGEILVSLVVLFCGPDLVCAISEIFWQKISQEVAAYIPD